MRHRTGPSLPPVDHLVLATPDLDEGVTYIQERFAVEVTHGGRHRDFGTSNALVSLGQTTYLEIIGPDPQRPLKELPKLFHIDMVDAPRLVTWATKGTNLHQIAASARASGVILGDVSEGARLRPDGSLLSWRLTDPYTDRSNGIIPFFIDWGDATHPATGLPPRCNLIAVTLEHPEAEAVERGLQSVGITAPVVRSDTARIRVTIQTPNGVVELD